MKKIFLSLVCLTALSFATNSCEEDKVDDKNDQNDAVACADLNFSTEVKANTDKDYIEYVFTASEIKEDDNVVYAWSINDKDKLIGTTDNPAKVFDYKFKENGDYKVCVFTETPDCPTGVTKCIDIKIDNIVPTKPVVNDNSKFIIEVTETFADANTGCPNIVYNFAISEKNPDLYILTASEYKADTVGYDWTVNKKSIESPTTDDPKRSIEYEFTEAGVFKVCVFVETPDCPNGTSFCKEFTVTEKK